MWLVLSACVRKNSQKGLGCFSNKDLHVVVQTAPAVRAAIGRIRLSNWNSGYWENGCGIKKLGFAKVFDTDTAADLTIMEEGNRTG